MNKKTNYVQTVQIGLDIAIPEGMTSKDVEKFIENEVTKLIHNKTKLVVMNGYYKCEDISHSYDIKEVNEMFNKPEYGGYYQSIHSFVSENKLENRADDVFGEGWEADCDVDQVQKLLNNIGEGYLVADMGEENGDDYIYVFKK